MSKGFKHGSSIVYFAAVLNIQYDPGYVCTVTSGNTTFTAPDTNGTWLCVVPKKGTWTVKQTNGTNTDTKSVSVSINGQTISVDIRQDLVLFDCYNGGWKVTPFSAHPVPGNQYGVPASPTITKPAEGQEVIRMAQNVGAGVYYSHGQSFDLTGFSKLYFLGYIINDDNNTEANTGLCIWPSLGSHWMENVVARTKTVDNNTTLDISKINGIHQIGFGFYHYSTVYLYQLILKR